MEEKLIVGIAAGLVSGIVVAWLKDHFFWTRQRQKEFQSKVFDEAVVALSGLRWDIGQARLRGEKEESRLPREETTMLVNCAKMRVRASYPAKVSGEFDKAVEMGVRAFSGREEFGAYIDQDVKAISYMAVELGFYPGLRRVKWRGRWQRLKGLVKRGS